MKLSMLEASVEPIYQTCFRAFVVPEKSAIYHMNSINNNN